MTAIQKPKVVMMDWKNKLLLSLATGLLLFNNLTYAGIKTLNIYTYDSFVSEWGPGPQLEKAFEAQCQCDIKFVAAEDGVSILNRMRIEGKKSKADVLLGLDNGLMEETRRLGFVKTHELPLDHLKAELNWQDKQFMPFDYGYFAFIYDSRKISQPANSLSELINSDVQVIYQDPRTSTPGQGLMTWMKAVYGDKTAEQWQQLAGHTVTVTKGWWEAYSMFLEGGSDYVLSYTTSPAYHAVVEGHNHYKAALFSEGHVTQTEVAAIAHTSQQPELAREFIRFLTSEAAQKIIPVTNWMLPVIDQVELPDAFDQLIQPEQIGFSPAEIAQQRKQWLREWRRSASQ
ncbi:thiamine ABC transporter substrate binding subunit [Oceanospirillum sediminis]|nr:thiamine ABC transporter substrate binding subunit [Oceanospirillum sediminis]